MVVAIPPVEPKDWHHPRVLSDIISPLYTLLYTPIIYTLLCVCVCCVHIVYTYVLYTIHMCIYTETHRPHTPIPPIPPIHHDTTQ